MSRYEVEVKSETRTDPEAVIGFDPPLRTYFITAFPDEETDEPYLWLGTRIEEFPSLETLIDAVRAEGFQLVGLKQYQIVAMLKEASQRHPPSAGERAGFVF